MSSFNRQGSDGLDRAAHLLVNLAVRGRENAPPANASEDQHSLVPSNKQNAPGASDNAEEPASGTPVPPAAPSNPSVLRKACQLWQHLQSCAEKGFVDVPESLLRSQFKNTADTSKALRKMMEDGLVQRSGAGGKGSPYLYRVTAASLAMKHYASQPVERRSSKKPSPAARRSAAAPAAASAAAPVALAPACGVASSSGAGEPDRASSGGGGLEPVLAAQSESAEVEPQAVDLPMTWRTKPRSGGRRPPRQITPPGDDSWWEFNPPTL